MFYGEFTPDDMRDRAGAARRSLGCWIVVNVLATGLLAFSLSAEAKVVFLSLLFACGVIPIGIWTFVSWVKWFHAVHDVAVARGRARFGGAWWAWAWLLPVVNAVLPIMMVADLWRAGDPPRIQRPLPPLLRRWWGFWVASCVVGYVERGATESFLYVIYSVLGLVAFVLSFRVIELLTDHAVELSMARDEPAEPPVAVG